MSYVANVVVDRFEDIQVNFNWVPGNEQVMTVWTFDFKMYQCGTLTEVFSKTTGFTLSNSDKSMSFNLSATELAALTEDSYDFRIRKTSPGVKVLTKGCWKFQ